MAAGGAGSPIRLPRSVGAAVERCRGHRKALRRWGRYPGLRGRKARSGRDLPEMTKVGGTSRHSPAALCRILPAFPEGRKARTERPRTQRVKIHREATLVHL